MDSNALFSSSAILYDGLFVLKSIDDTAGDANEAVVNGLQAIGNGGFSLNISCVVCA